MKKTQKNSQNPRKITLQKVQGPQNDLVKKLPDSLRAWIDCYLHFVIAGVRSDGITAKITLHLNRFVDFYESNYAHDKISTCLQRDVVAWQKFLVHEGMANSTVNNHISSLSAFTSWVSAVGPRIFAVGDPAKGISELGLPTLEPRALTADQVNSLKNVCDRLERFHQTKNRRAIKSGSTKTLAFTRPWRDRAIVYFLLSTGLRREELVNLDLRQVQPSTVDALKSAKRAKVTKVKGKGKTERVVFLSNDARLALADYLEKERPLDATNGETALFLSAHNRAARNIDGRLSLQAINQMLSQIGRWHDAEVRDQARKISPLRPHDLRHTFAFHLAQATNADAYELERRLGHQSQRYIQRYTNPPEHIAAGYVENF